MDNIFIQLAIILGLSSLLGFGSKILKIPLMVAYLCVGLILSIVAAFDVGTLEALHFLPEIGIAFMLFLVGMELDLREIKSLGKPIIIGSLFQVIVSSVFGLSIAVAFGLGVMESWYLGLGLAFSSTVVVVKLLLDKRELTSLYGKLSLGILLVEDLIAVIVLLGLTVTSSLFGLGYYQAFPVFTFIFKVILLFGVVILLNRFFLGKVFKLVAESQELLFLTALAWCFIYVSFALILGFSVLIGAFLAGVALASSQYRLQIGGKVKPLRDFFVALFFVYLGTQVNIDYLKDTYLLVILFTLYAIFIKPVIFLVILGLFGFRKHTLFQTAINLSQISEFSLILLVVGLQKNVVSPSSLTVIALTAVISMIISSLMIENAGYLYKYTKRFVGFFERKNFHHFMETIKAEELIGHAVVIGGHRIGGEIIRLLRKEKVPMIVLDFNPHLIQSLLESQIAVVYGDMGDPDVLDGLNLHDAKIVISTAPGLLENKLLLEQIKTRNIRIPVIVRADTLENAKKLYKAGADFVIIPEVLAGDFIVDKLREHMSGKYFEDRSEMELERLEKKTLAWE